MNTLVIDASIAVKWVVEEHGRPEAPWSGFTINTRALLRAGKNDEAIVKSCTVAVIRPDDLIIKGLLFDASFQKRDWLPALALVKELARRLPDVPRRVPDDRPNLSL